MIWIRRTALKRRYFCLLLTLLILIPGLLAVLNMPMTDIAKINTPVISVIWSYNDVAPDDTLSRLLNNYGDKLQSQVNNIDHIESQSRHGQDIVKFFFRSNVDMRTALATITTISREIINQMPPGVTAERVLNDNSADAATLQLGPSPQHLTLGAITATGKLTAVAALSALMMLLVLGSWRSALTISISIVLIVLLAIIGLYVSGETLNLMTLSGLALGIGILIDNAVMNLENIQQHLDQNDATSPSNSDAAQQFQLPALIVPLCVGIVFLPILLTSGTVHDLFAPMADAVIFTMLASVIVTQALTCDLSRYLLKQHNSDNLPVGQLLQSAVPAAQAQSPSMHLAVRMQQSIEQKLQRLCARYSAILLLAMENRNHCVAIFFGIVVLSLALIPWPGEDFFPDVDSGQLRIQATLPSDNTSENARTLTVQIEQQIQRVIAENELVASADYSDRIIHPSRTAAQDIDILITLDAAHLQTDQAIRMLRQTLAEHFPGIVFSILPVNLFSQISDSDNLAPMVVRVTGSDSAVNMKYAQAISRAMHQITGLAEIRLVELNDSRFPTAGTEQTGSEKLSITPAIDIFAMTYHRHLGEVAQDIDHIVKEIGHDLPEGVTIASRGQAQLVGSAFSTIRLGLSVAVGLIYLLMAIHTRSWIDPLVTIIALSAVWAGIIWMLFVTQTTLSVPALTGTLMCFGISAANSIALINVARARLNHSGFAIKAALEAGLARFRPVLMTALALTAAMVPLALGLGKGGELCAPLGRALIGGLIAATITTLFFVPILFSIVHRNTQKDSIHLA